MRAGRTAAFLISILVLSAFFVPGCKNADILNPETPVTVSLWHNYGGQMKETMDALVREFNDTVGRERGVIVSVTSVSSSASIVKMLEMAANGEPGAPALPDVTTCYPITALFLKERGLIADLKKYFSAAELSDYIPAFLEEGYIGAELASVAALKGMHGRASHRAALAISVRQKFWHRGVGTQMMNRLIEHARAGGIEVIELEVRSDNASAINLYQKMGFERIGTYRSFFRIGDQEYDADLMNLYLK